MKRPASFLAALALAAAGPLAAQAPTVDGEVTKIDRAQARVTLRHGEIRSLDMPAMTMSYRVADAKLLDGVAVGDKVRFAAEKRNGNYTVVALAKAR